MNLRISPESVWGLWAMILACVALCIYLERTFRWAARISGPFLALLLAMILSNVGILPAAAPAYDFAWDYLVPCAIPLLLVRADIARVIRSTGRMFVMFHVSSLGTIIGAFIAAWLFRNHLSHPAESAGIMTGSYIGGSVNFLALKLTYAVPESVSNPLLVADNFIMAGVFGILIAMASAPAMRRWLKQAPATPNDPAGSAEGHPMPGWGAEPVSLLDIAVSLALAVGIAAASHALAALARSSVSSTLGQSLFGNVYLVLTVLSLLLASAARHRLTTLRGSEELGSYFLYIFLFMIGLPADLAQVLRDAPLMFAFCAVIAASNLVLTVAMARMFRFRIEDIVLCVNATLGGPASAAAMAVAVGWPRLVLPGLLLGIYGYAIGTFLGILVCDTLRAALR